MVEKKETLRDKKERLADVEVLQAVNYGLEEAVLYAGGVLSGFAVKFGELDCLMTVKADVGSKKCVAFVGAPTLRDVFRKSVQAAYNDGLVWKVDKWNNGQN